MGFRGTLWRPDPQTVASLRHGKHIVEKSGLVLTEKQAAERAKLRAAGHQVEQVNVERRTVAEEARRFGQPHYGH